MQIISADFSCKPRLIGICAVLPLKRTKSFKNALLSRYLIANLVRVYCYRILISLLDGTISERRYNAEHASGIVQLHAGPKKIHFGSIYCCFCICWGFVSSQPRVCNIAVYLCFVLSSKINSAVTRRAYRPKVLFNDPHVSGGGKPQCRSPRNPLSCVPVIALG
jgi:hypothetical protein